MTLATDIILGTVTILLGVLNIIQVVLSGRKREKFAVKLATAILKAYLEGKLEALEDLSGKKDPKKMLCSSRSIPQKQTRRNTLPM